MTWRLLFMAFMGCYMGALMARARLFVPRGRWGLGWAASDTVFVLLFWLVLLVSLP